jgi:RimJ/RimL family protein N-acetyltransferase
MLLTNPILRLHTTRRSWSVAKGQTQPLSCNDAPPGTACRHVSSPFKEAARVRIPLGCWVWDHGGVLVETPRLVLRRFREADAALFAAYRSDPAVARYQTWEAPVSLALATRDVVGFAGEDPDEPGWFQYAIELKAGPRLIGDIAVNLHANRMQAEIGFTVAAGFQRRGLGSEAVSALLTDLLERRGLHRVSAQCDVRNTRCVRLLRRVGFQPEGRRPQFTWQKDQWIDILLFGILAD